MKKNILFAIVLFVFTNNSFAQKELWGVNSGDVNSDSPTTYSGNITKYDINGENPALVHEFDLVQGRLPNGKLFLASNGKLYGTTMKGGIYSSYTDINSIIIGTLYEYDLILDKFTVLHNFMPYVSPTNYGSQPQIGVIEPIPGILYGAAGDKVFTYNIVSGVLTLLNNFNLPISVIVNSELMKASDGNLYGTFKHGGVICANYTVSPQTAGTNGAIIKVNTNTNIVSVVHYLDCNETIDGSGPQGQLIEVTPGKLYGVTYIGAHGTGGSSFVYTDGTAFEFNIYTNTYTKKVDFIGNVSGKYPNALISGGNGKLYGTCPYGGAPSVCTPDPQDRGTLFSYDPTTNILDPVYPFSFCGDQVLYPSSLMKTSNGYFMGTIPNGALFKYNATTNTVTMPDYSNVICPCPNLNNCSNLIEICRKPFYHEFTPNTFAPNSGSTFTYDIQNTNATTYVWKKDNAVLPIQTTAVLNLTNITTADSGAYTCTMTNECGTTVTMNLYINVDNLGIDLSDYLKNKITLYPNPTKNILNIKLPENRNVEINKISIVNLLGQTIFEDIKNNQNIDVSTLQKGIYILLLKTSDGNWNGKFVKE